MSAIFHLVNHSKKEFIIGWELKDGGHSEILLTLLRRKYWGLDDDIIEYAYKECDDFNYKELYWEGILMVEYNK
jgi:HD-like signal output (HDOD) protein